MRTDGSVTPVTTVTPPTSRLPERSAGVTVMAPRERSRPSLLAGIVMLLGLATAAVGLWLNASFLWSFGRTSDAGITLAVIGIVTDAITLVLPAVTAGLWARRRPILTIAAVTVYLVAVVMTGLNALGFAATHIGDAVASRQAATTTSIATTEQRSNRIAVAQLAVNAAATARQAECTRRGPLCREREAEERAALAALDRAVTVPIPIAATIGAADPQIEAATHMAAWLSRGLVAPSAGDVQMLRLLGVALMPILGGLLVAFGVGLAQPRNDLTA